MRRTSFARTWTPAPKLRDRTDNYLKPVERPGVVSDCSGMGVAVGKGVQHRNRRLLDLARGMPCLLRIEGVCIGGTETTVACHSNWAIHGKGGARKADDQFTVHGCASCHRWLDQGNKAPAVLKQSCFLRGHARQITTWQAIAADTQRPDADRAAARWALELLKEMP